MPTICVLHPVENLYRLYRSVCAYAFPMIGRLQVPIKNCIYNLQIYNLCTALYKQIHTCFVLSNMYILMCAIT